MMCRVFVLGIQLSGRKEFTVQLISIYLLGSHGLEYRREMFQHSKVSLSILLNLYVDTRVWSSYVPKSKKLITPGSLISVFFSCCPLNIPGLLNFGLQKSYFQRFGGNC